ncbi:sensor histidine kinase [Curtobacterium flaccumfaciens]|uniref:sensor histidine kinase n=1 Tax=Curtobacterium flaccumfaciens TaxID=2035 RepID=UPI003994922A
MTLLFAVTTAACLVVLGAIALHVDNASREARVDLGTMQQARHIARQLDYSTGSLTLGAVSSSTALPENEVFGILESGAIVLASPNQRSLPSDGNLAVVVRRTSQLSGGHHFVFPDVNSRELRWSSVPVPRLGHVGAVVLVGGPAVGTRSHEELTAHLTFTILALAVIASVLGHIVSGRAMHPARTALEQQEQFLVEAAHELRTPLTRLKLVLDTSAAADPAAMKDALDRAAAQVESLTGLVDALLLRAQERSAARLIDKRLLRLDVLARFVVEQYFSAASVSVTASPTTVFGNPELLAQALRNLIENAARYAPTSAVNVQVDHTGIQVTDRGPGIPRHQRARALRTGVGLGRGTGSGLPIVAWIARVHGGSVTLSATDGGGLTVHLALGPVATP